MEPIEYLKKIEESGYEAYIVGGYVRDYLLGISSSDVDITTSATPKDLSRIFGVQLSDELGCVNIRTSKYNIDMTTYRSESNYKDRHPKSVVYIDDLLTDLYRRDFTMNAICMDSRGEIKDPLNGRKDLENRTLKVIGNIEEKFTEDPLRMMRALRLSITYDFKIEEEALVFILNNKKLLRTISRTRLKECIGKILISDNVLKGLDMLKSLGLLEIFEIDYTDDYVPVKDYIGSWAQLSYSEYPFTKVEKARLKNIREIVSTKLIDMYTLLEYGIYDTLIAGEILKIDKTLIIELYDSMPIKKEDELNIDGNKIKSLLRIEDGPKIKEIKRDLINRILSGNLTNSEEDLSNYILEDWK